jgi:phage shock protein PspC (stress-responsive transcriptional regulator)
MKATIKVSISRSAFHLNGDAYEALREYLNRLEKHFSSKKGGKEIVSDIEERLAELLTARITTPEQVVTITLVEEVIGIMGMPGDMDDGEFNRAAVPPPQSRKKHLYRDVNNKMIGGVCSGLAAYFGIDVSFFRLFLVLLFAGLSVTGLSGGGFLLVAYLVLWIVVPPALTARERMDMRNSHATIFDIQKKVENEISALRQKWERKGKIWTSEMEKEVLEASMGTRPQEHVLTRLFKVAFRAVMILVGVLLLLIAVCGLITLPVVLFVGTVLSDVVLFDLFDLVAININLTLCKVLISVVLFLPLLGLLYIGLKAIVGYRSRFRIGLIMFLLWLAAGVTLVISASSSALRFGRHTDVEEEVRISAPYSTLYVDVPEAYCDVVYNKALFEYNNIGIVFWENDRNDEAKAYVLPCIEVVQARDSGAIRVRFIKTVPGRTHAMARARARETPVRYTLRDSMLLLDPLVYSRAHKWAGEVVSVKIYVPQDKDVRLAVPHKNGEKRRYIKIDPNVE